MSLFSVDREKCKRDGICSASCPAGLIEMKDKESFPTPIAGAEELCITCGHCVAVCPHGALSLEAMKADDCPPVNKELLPGPDMVEHFLRYRRSIRRYKDKRVDRDLLERLIDIAGFAPSGHNLQPVRWLVFERKEEIGRIAGIVISWMRMMIENQPEIAQPFHFDRVVQAWERGEDRVLRGAPALIVAHGNAALTTSQPSCIIALTYLELAAASLGLGACWAGYFNAAATFYPPMKEALDLPSGHQSFGAMMVGHPTYSYHRLPLRKTPQITWR